MPLYLRWVLNNFKKYNKRVKRSENTTFTTDRSWLGSIVQAMLTGDGMRQPYPSGPRQLWTALACPSPILGALVHAKSFVNERGKK